MTILSKKNQILRVLTIVLVNLILVVLLSEIALRCIGIKPDLHDVSQPFYIKDSVLGWKNAVGLKREYCQDHSCYYFNVSYGLGVG